MLQKNIEIKVFLNGAEQASRIATKLENWHSQTVSERDEFFPTKSKYLKSKYVDGELKSIVQYERLSSPKPRECSFEAFAPSSAISSFLSDLRPDGVVSKLRKTFSSGELRINIDEIHEAGFFLEVEASSAAGVSEQIDQLLHQLNVQRHQIIPYSSIHIVNMMLRAKEWQRSSSPSMGKLVVVDGPSASGKSTLLTNVMDASGPRLHYAQRHTTRAPRPGDEVSRDYEFISNETFFANALVGEYIEFRDFEFGMSYGLPWVAVMPYLISGKNVLGLINLGNGAFLKKVAPFAETVLLTADPTVIEGRLRSRGGLREEQIDERVGNAKLAKSWAHGYDHVVDTGVCGIDEMTERVLELFRDGA